MSVFKERIFGLDVLRAIAILMVVYQHGYIYIDQCVNQSFYFKLILDGVGMFFVLSGFLIGTILLKLILTGNFEAKNLLNFWIRRWFRTLPTYYFVLFLLIVSYSALSFFNGNTLPFTFKLIIKYVFFIQNFNSIHPHFFEEAWSLSIEEWFYLFIPFLLFCSLYVFKKQKKFTLLFWIIFIIICVTTLRFYKIHTNETADYMWWTENIRKQVITRLDAIMFGFLGAYIAFTNLYFWKKNKFIYLFIGIILLIYPNIMDKYNPFFSIGENNFIRNYLFLTTNSIGTLFLLPFLSEYKIKKNNYYYRIITFISTISYSLYLVNDTFVKLLILNILPQFHNSIIKYSLHWILSILIAYLLYSYFEKPFTNLRNKISVNDNN